MDIEGGVTMNAIDRGGTTNYGITIDVLSDYLGRAATTDDVRNLKPADARAIYRKVFWDEPKLELLNHLPSLQLALFDFGVNSGPAGAMRVLQNILNVKADGELGPKTLAAINKVKSQKQLVIQFVRERRILMSRICQRDKNQTAFLTGWIDRTHAVDDAMIAIGLPLS